MTCFECGAPSVCNHHVVPRILGGTKTVPLCGDCHATIHGRGIGRTDLIRLALAVKRGRGEKLGGSLPFGYRLNDDGRTLTPDAAEQDVIVRVRALRADGLSFARIAAQLAADANLSVPWRRLASDDGGAHRGAHRQYNKPA